MTASHHPSTSTKQALCTTTEQPIPRRLDNAHVPLDDLKVVSCEGEPSGLTRVPEVTFLWRKSQMEFNTNFGGGLKDGLVMR